MHTKTFPAVLVLMVTILCLSSCSGDTIVPGDIFLASPGYYPTVDGYVAVLTGWKYLPHGEESDLKIFSLIVILTPPNKKIIGAGIKGPHNGVHYKGESSLDIQLNPPNDYEHSKKLVLQYEFDGHKKTALIQNHQFDWQKHQIFLVMYSNSWKPSFYALTNDFKGAPIPKKTLADLRKQFPQGINTPLK
jgi:hypothetical protein